MAILWSLCQVRGMPLLLGSAAWLLWALGSIVRAEALPRFSNPDVEAWWRQHPTPEAWVPAGAQLLETARGWFNPDRPDTWGPEYRGWYDVARWSQLATAETLAQARLEAETFHALSRSPGLISATLAALQPQDRLPGVLGTLGTLIRAEPEGVRDFPQLAVAVAVVWDQPFPKDWPHPQVPRSSLPLGSGGAVERFRDFVAQERRGRLEFRLRDLTVEELVFLVDTPVAASEFAWARDRFRTSLSQFDRVFFQVAYDNRRLQQRLFTWPANLPYTLETILNTGGICTDQAYFAATVGKARGIPTLLFVGQGRDGGHAWIGYLRRNRTWDLNVGRYAEQNYPVGTAFNPQTWQPVKDSELIHHAANVLRNARYADAVWLLRWAQDNPDASWAGATFEVARTLLPHWIEPWRARADALAAAGANLPVQRDFLRAWSTQFSRMPDFKVEGQERLARLLLESGDRVGARALQEDIIRQNRRKRFDLGLGTAVETLLQRLEQQDWRGADLEFRRLVRQFDARTGGSFFYQVVQPYIVTLAEEGQTRQARAAWEFALKALNPEPDSILTMEFERLGALLGKAGG